MPAWEPLWQIAAERGAVFPWIPADQLLAVAHFDGGETGVEAGEASVLWLDPSAPAGRAATFPAGAPLVLENSGSEALDVTVDGLAGADPIALAIRAGERAELPESVWRQAGWRRLRAAGAEWSVLLIDPPFAAGWARLAGPGRLVIDLGNIAEGTTEPVALHLDLWLAGQPVCPAESQPDCRIQRSGVSQEGHIVLEPVVIGAFPFPGGAGEP